MEELFKKVLQNNGKNTVDEIIKWLKNSKLIEGKTEQSAVQMFSGEPNKNNIGFAKFQEVVMKFASDKKWDLETVLKNLTKGAGEGAIANAVKTGIGNFFKKK